MEVVPTCKKIRKGVDRLAKRLGRFLFSEQLLEEEGRVRLENMKIVFRIAKQEKKPPSPFKFNSS
jgi:hypothetical protein